MQQGDAAEHDQPQGESAQGLDKAAQSREQDEDDHIRERHTTRL